MNKFKNYEDFVNKATDCEKAQAAQDYLGSRYISRKGLAAYGPPYPSDTLARLKKCTENLNHWYRDCYHYGGPMPNDDNYDNEKEKCNYSGMKLG